jgi:hypothetical protein
MMKRSGSSEDTIKGRMRAAGGTPLPHDEDDDEASGKNSERVPGKDLGESSYGKAGRKSRGVLRRDPDGKVEVSPDQDRGQANDKYGKDGNPANKTDGKVGKDRRSGKRLTKDDDDEEIPELMLPLIDDEVDFVHGFIEEEATRRLQEIEDQEDDQEEYDETRRVYEEQKEKLKKIPK